MAEEERRSDHCSCCGGPVDPREIVLRPLDAASTTPLEALHKRKLAAQWRDYREREGRLPR